MNKIERETIKQLRTFLQKILHETILPPLVEQGFLSENYSVDVHVVLKPLSAEAALRKMELKIEEEK